MSGEELLYLFHGYGYAAQIVEASGETP